MESSMAFVKALARSLLFIPFQQPSSVSSYSPENLVRPNSSQSEAPSPASASSSPSCQPRRLPTNSENYYPPSCPSALSPFKTHSFLPICPAKTHPMWVPSVTHSQHLVPIFITCRDHKQQRTVFSIYCPGPEAGTGSRGCALLPTLQ